VDVADLRPLDLRGEVAQQRLVGVQPLAARGQREHADLGLGQRGELGAVDVGPEVAQLPQGGGVERAGLHARCAERAQPPAHLAGRTRGERDREDLRRRVDAGRDAVRDPVGDRPGLAGAGAGQDADGAAERLGDAPLLRVERGQQVLGGRHGWGTTPDRAQLQQVLPKP
jgi:hypothetical protein